MTAKPLVFIDISTPAAMAEALAAADAGPEAIAALVAEKGQEVLPAFVPTPGFHLFPGRRPTRIQIRIRSDRNGRRRATYWSQPAGRWLPLPIAEADGFLAQDLADAAS